jgi:hypothetical protein
LHLRPEILLVAACCRWPPSPERDEAVRAAASGVDWPLVHRVAVRHRVEGLVWDALRRAEIALPQEAARPLQAAAAVVARHNLSLAAESVRLRRAFEAAQVPVLFVKGLTLAQLAYGSLSLKMGWDIDILVPLDKAEAAAAVLEDAGYRLFLPAGPRARAGLGAWHVQWKESGWRRDPDRIFVELHTRLADNPALIPEITVDSPQREVEIARGLSLPTLAEEELFAYLCVHGASSAWFRLKWVADVAALLSARPPEEIDSLYRRSQALGAGRAAAQALLLCRALFETQLSPVLLKELESDRTNRWLAAMALRKLAGRSMAEEIQAVPLGTASLYLTQLALLPGIRFKWAELRRQLVDPQHRLDSRLPPSLAFLLPLQSLARRLKKART